MRRKQAAGREQIWPMADGFSDENEKQEIKKSQKPRPTHPRHHRTAGGAGYDGAHASSDPLLVLYIAAGGAGRGAPGLE